MARHRIEPPAEVKAKAANAARIGAAFQQAHQARQDTQAVRDQLKAAQHHIGAH
jgi:hypothetical protein